MKQLLYGFLTLLAVALPAPQGRAAGANDFSQDDLHAPPSGAMIDAAEGQVSIVENEGDLGFGDAGNRLLQLHKAHRSDPIPRCSWPFDEMEEGAISFKMLLPVTEQNPHPLLSVFVMRGDRNHIGIAITFDKEHVVVEGPEGDQRFAYGFNASVSHEITLRLHPEQSFSIEINGQPFPDDRRFSYITQTGGLLNQLQFAIAWKDTEGAMALLDDLHIAPAETP